MSESVHLRPRLLHRLAHPDHRRLPEVDVAHALQRQPLEAAVGAHEVLHELVLGVGEQLGGRGVLGQLSALAQDGDVVAHLDGLVDVVGDEDDGLADLALEAQELVLEPLAVDRVDGPEGLVHEHQRRVDGKRPRHADALALPAGELGGVAVARVGRQRHQLEQLVHALGDAALVPAQQLGHGGDVVGHGEMREQADLLNGVADVAAQLGGGAVLHALAVDEDVALGDVDHAVDHAHGGGLAAAGGADQHADLAGGQLEREVLHGGLVRPGVALRDVAELEGRGLSACVRPL